MPRTIRCQEPLLLEAGARPPYRARPTPPQHRTPFDRLSQRSVGAADALTSTPGRVVALRGRDHIVQAGRLVGRRPRAHGRQTRKVHARSEGSTRVDARRRRLQLFARLDAVAARARGNRRASTHSPRAGSHRVVGLARKSEPAAHADVRQLGIGFVGPRRAAPAATAASQSVLREREICARRTPGVRAPRRAPRACRTPPAPSTQYVLGRVKQS